jgi:hypothetical protein
VEAPVKSVIVFLSGLTVTFVGAFIRSCTDGIPAEFARSWCGNAPPSQLFSTAHAHCTGCVVIAAGLALLAIAPLFAHFSERPAKARANQQ